MLAPPTRALSPGRPVAVLATGLIFATFIATVWLFGPAFDALGYLAAGERLNAGHALYALVAGDRPIHVDPPFFTAPFLYPPSFAILWRPLALLPFMGGLWLWWGAVIAAMSWWVRRLPPLALLLLAVPIGETMATGNLNGLVMVAFGLAWLWRDRVLPLAAMVGTLAAWKVFPGLLVVWMVATGRWRAAGWTVVVAMAWTLAGIVLVGQTVPFVETIRSTQAMGISLAYLFGLPVLSLMLAGFGAAAVIVLGGRDQWAYRVALLTAVLAWPSLGLPSLAMLGGLAARPQLGGWRPAEEGHEPQRRRDGQQDEQHDPAAVLERRVGHEAEGA